MPLTDVVIRRAKTEGKPRKLADSGGLFLLLTPAGTRLWRLKYRFLGKEKLLSLGAYPEVTLQLARDRRDEARKLLASGKDPSAERKAARLARAEGTANSFEAVAREWFNKHSAVWAESHSSKIIRRLEREVFPYLGERPVAEIEPPEVLAVLRRIEARGRLETTHRTQQACSRVFRYAVASGLAARDPTADLRGAVPPAKERHHASITDPKQIGALLRAIDGYDGSLMTRCALRLAPLVFVRSGELRMARWSEFYFDRSEWRIPAERMKSRHAHIVPLSRQSVEILRELQLLTGPEGYLFPGVRNASRHMSDNTLNAALRRLGYSKDQMTGHGFRSMASTLLNEQGWDHEAIERQLAHVEGNAVKAAYNFAQHLPTRRNMMQAWADYLDGLKEGSDKVVNIRKVVGG